VQEEKHIFYCRVNNNCSVFTDNYWQNNFLYGMQPVFVHDVFFFPMTI